MKITPQDIHHKEFKRTMRGYSEEEVDIFLDEIAENFEKLYKQNHTNEEDINKLKDKLKTYEKMELTLQNTLLTAQKSAEDVQENAKKEAAEVKRNATLDVKNVMSKAEKQKQLFSETFSKIKSLQGEFKIKIKNNIENLLAKLDQMDSQERDLIQQIEKEFENIPEIEVLETEEEPVSEIPKTKKTEPEKPSEKSEKKKELVKVGAQKEAAQKESVDTTSAVKADASKSDIASEAEIDAFLEQEEQVSTSNDEKKGIMSRLFNRKETADNDSKEEKAEKKAEAKVKAKSAKVKNKKSKKKRKQRKKNTEEITEAG